MDISLKFFVYVILVLFMAYLSRFFYRFYIANKISELQKRRLLYSVYSRRHLYDLTSREFEEWCTYLLKKVGYEEVRITSEVADGGKDIICMKDGKEIYVECKKFMFKELANHLNRDNKNSSDYKEKKEVLVGRPILQKLVGAMVGDGVHQGLVITTSDFNNNALEYIKGLPTNYQIKLINGRTLCEMYENYLESKFDVNLQIPDIESIKF